MRFHHSTRRGRNRFGQGGNSTLQAGGKFGHPNHSFSSRWAQLSYCRQTNIHFNSRVPVDLPDEMRHKSPLSSESNCHQPGDQPAEDDPVAMALAERNFLNGRPQSNKHYHNNNHHLHHHHHHHQQQQRLQMDDNHLHQFDKLSLLSEQPHHVESDDQSKLSSRTSTVRRSVRKHKEHEVDQLENLHKNQDQHSSETENSKPAASKTSAKFAKKSEENKHIDPLPRFDLEAAREKLVAQVDKHPFWSTKAAKRMRLLDLHERQIYIYELTSYCERRDLEWRYEAYRGAKWGSSALFGGVQARRFNVGGNQPQTTPSSQAQSPTATSGGEFMIDSESPNSQGKPTPPPPTPASGHNQSTSGGVVRSQFVFEQASQVDRASMGSPLRQHNSHQLQRQTSSSSTVGASSGGGPGNRLRRSCSSATSSPVRVAQGQPLTCVGSNPLGRAPTSSSFVNLDQTSSQIPLTATALCESRPMPSPELVWSIEPPETGAVVRPEPFTCYLQTSEVPGTSFVKRCHGCQGRGRLKCASCYGVGYEVCLSCTGRGSLRSYSALSAGGGLGRGSAGCSIRSSTADSSGTDQNPRNRSSGGGVTGSMWGNATSSASSGRFAGDSTSGLDETGGGISTQVCANCSGAGQKRCWICAGRSFITCTACAGTGSLRCFLNLNITYLNHRDEICLNNADGLIPRDRLKLSSGLLLADETADRLRPLTGGSQSAKRPPPDGASDTTRAHDSCALLNPGGIQQNQNSQPPPSLEQFARPGELVQLGALSAKLLDKHWQAYKHERLLKQRHRVTQIECFKVDWEFRKKRGHFVVYGDERKVYIAKYPFKSICNIT